MKDRKMRRSLAIIGMFIVGVSLIVILAGNLLGPKVAELTIKDCQGKSNIPLEFKEGETIVMSVLSNQDAELHIHGYDIKKNLTANKNTQITFRAAVPGEFEIELEDKCPDLFELVVKSANQTS